MGIASIWNGVIYKLKISPHTVLFSGCVIKEKYKTVKINCKIMYDETYTNYIE